MDRDWALDIFLWTERPGTIGHMIGGFLYDEPAQGLEENVINEGIRALCFLTRATKVTAGYGEALATRFLSVDRARELYLRWRGRHRRVEVTYAWCSSSGDSSAGDSSGDGWGAAAAAENAAKRRNWRMISGISGTAEAHRAMHPSGRHESVAGPNEAGSA